MCRNFRSFLQEFPINMGPIFHEKKIRNYGSDFQNFPGAKPQTILKIWCVFVAKSQKMGTFFGTPLNMGTYFWKNYPEYGYGS